MLIDILGTKVDIGTSKIRTLVAVAVIFQNGRQLYWSKLSKSLKSHAMSHYEGHHLERNNPERQIISHNNSMELYEVICQFMTL